MTRLSDIMTEDEFVAHAQRIMKLFLPKQPSEKDFMALRIFDDAPNDIFIQLSLLHEDMVETAGQMLELWHCEPEGHA